MKQVKDFDLRCISCNSLNLKFVSDNLYKCLACGEFTDENEDFQFERIKHHKGRED